MVEFLKVILVDFVRFETDHVISRTIDENSVPAFKNVILSNSSTMIPGAVCKALTLLFGVMYPAYSSYKTVKTKNVKNYVKWMMYWIVFAAFICIESLTDIFLEFWFPFYYDIKLIVLLWISCPFTKGSTIIYKQLVHPTLLKKETDIDEFLVNVKSRTYNALTSTAKQTFQMTAAIVVQHTAVGRLPMVPMVLQQIINFNEENVPEQPTTIIKTVKKRKPSTVIIEEFDSDSSTPDYLPNEPKKNIEEMPIQRPKRSKVQNQKKPSSIGKITDSKILNNDSRRL